MTDVKKLSRKAFFYAKLLLICAMIYMITVAGRAETSAKSSKQILAFGDSLIAGYGLSVQNGFTAKLQAALNKADPNAMMAPINVVNAGLSGDTSGGGLSRIEWMLAGQDYDLILLELGANDALRGLDPKQTKLNLDHIIRIIKDQTNAKILFAGMLAPPNMGADYGDHFNALYPDLAASHQLPFYPFFLEGVAGIPELNQDDGIHPNPKGVDLIVQNLEACILGLLDGVESPKTCPIIAAP